MLSVEWRYLYPQGSRSFRRGPSPREKASGKKKKKICKCAIVTSCVLTSNKKNHCISISHTHTLSLTHTHSHTHSHTHTHNHTHIVSHSVSKWWREVVKKSSRSLSSFWLHYIGCPPEFNPNTCCIDYKCSEYQQMSFSILYWTLLQTSLRIYDRRKHLSTLLLDIKFYQSILISSGSFVKEK